MLIQTEDKSLYRDTKSMALVSKDVEAMNKYKEEKRRQKKLNEVVEDVESLKSDISEIKKLLLQMVNKDG